MSLDTFFVLDSEGQPITEDTARLQHIKEYLTETCPLTPRLGSRRTTHTAASEVLLHPH